MALDDLGLVPALRRFVDLVKERTKFSAEILINGSEQRLSSALEVSIFRICQEALQNIEKHAKAGYMRIKLDYQNEWLYVIIEDNGIGFSEKDVLAQKTDSFGLLSMRERVELIGGTMTIRSDLGMGTKIIIQAPIEYP